MTRRGLISSLCVVAVAAAWACTSAIVGGSLTSDGRPILWKNRDTSSTDNFIARMPSTDGTMSFVALFNAGDSTLSEAWMGMNEAGFAIMNTHSYNIAPDTAKFADQEGRVMARALSVCRDIKDFETLLDTLPKPLGVTANFGVIDANGDGAFYETNDHHYTKFSLAEATQDILVRTNYSETGSEGNGKGYIRCRNAWHLLADPIKRHAITPATFTEGLSRSFYHDMEGKDMSRVKTRWLVDQDFIPRRTSSASVAIQGITPGMTASDMVMWVAMGYPPVAHVQMVTLDSIPESLLPDAHWHSPECDAAAERKAEVFPIKEGNGQQYIDVQRVKAIDARQRQLSREAYRRMGINL